MMVWRRVVESPLLEPAPPPLGLASPPLVSAQACSRQPGVETAAQGHRRWRRSRGRRSDGGNRDVVSPPMAQNLDGEHEDPLPLSSSGDDESQLTHVMKPRRVIDRSAAIAHREDELRRALLVTVIGDSLVGLDARVRELIASQFQLALESLSLFRSGPASFILALPDEDTATRVYNAGRPIIGQDFRLLAMRWSRFMHSSASSLSSAVDIELRGIPAHAWELATAEQLLNEFCWIGGVHPANVDRRDVFQVVAWCSDPSCVPSEMDLDIIEPPLADNISGPAKRVLRYPISITVTPFNQPSTCAA